MSFVGTIAGIMAFGMTDAVVGQVMNNWQAGIVPGVIAGAWTAWPLFHFEGARHDLFLHPAPKIYSRNVEDAFSDVRDYLRETTYNYGDKWRGITADTATMRIVADLSYQEEELHVEITPRGEMRDRREFVKRHIKLECQMKSEAGRAVIQFDFSPRAEGYNVASCDTIIEHILTTIDANLGQGQPLKQLPVRALGAPPWWLIVVTGVALAFLAGDAWHTMIQ
jgi:hypothetical protein